METVKVKKKIICFSGFCAKVLCEVTMRCLNFKVASL